MQILSHRGYWKNPTEKNQLIAFENSFKLGFGIETDIRDYCQELVISHDIPSSECFSLQTIFSINSFNNEIPLALNIKSDGLQKELLKIVQLFSLKNYFAFDMSVPDTLGYIKLNIPFFSRQSEYEKNPPFYEYAQGIWLDCFKTNWYDENLILQHLENKKQIAIVSPELHKRPHQDLWQFLKNNHFHSNKNILLCTDFPDKAYIFFNKS